MYDESQTTYTTDSSIKSHVYADITVFKYTVLSGRTRIVSVGAENRLRDG